MGKQFAFVWACLAVAACSKKPDDFHLPPTPDGGPPPIDAPAPRDAVDAMADASLNVADLAVTITDSPDPIAANATLTYTILVTDNGGLDATNVKVEHRLPSGDVAFVSATGIGWTCNAVGQIVTCTRSSLLVGAAPTISVKITTPPIGGTITSTVDVSSDTPDTDLANNTATAMTTVQTPADLAIGMTDAPDPSAPSGTLTYSITVTNNGPGTATALSVLDTLPANVGFVSGTGSGWTCTAAGQMVTCTLATLAASTSSVITLTATAPSTGGAISNTATVGSSTPDTVPGNNSATTMTTINPSADLSIAVNDAPDPVIASGTLTYTIDVANAGPDTASNLTMTNTLAGNASFIDATGGGWSCGAVGQVVTCTRAALVIGSAPSITIHIHAPPTGGTLSDTATIGASGSTDLDNANNSATAMTTVMAQSDLSIAIVDSPDPVATSGALSYTLNMTNAGPSPADTVTVTDTLPAGVTFGTASGTGWACGHSGQVVTCTATSLAVGAVPAITINVTAPSTGGTITDNATIASTITDPTAGNNSASAMTTVNAPADLELVLAGSPDPVTADSILTYTIDITNHGPADATNLTVTDRIPDGNTTVQTASGSGWACGSVGQLVTCTRPTALSGGAVPTITITVKTPPTAFSTLVDTATVTSSTSDSDPSNNSKTVSTNGSTPSADLSVAIADSPDPVSAGQKVTYTISTSNAGPQDATGVSVTLSLPLSGTFFSVIGTNWVCPAPSGGKIVCTTSTSITAGTSAPDITLVWNAPMPGGFSIVLGASVAGTSSDPNSGNNSTSNDTTVTP